MYPLILSEKVNVLFKDYPQVICWRGKDYRVKKLMFHHKYKEGDTLFHVFSVVSETLFFRLNLNSDNLTWVLEGVNSAV